MAEPTPLGRVQRAGSNAYVARLISMGKSWQYIKHHLGERYGLGAGRTLDAAYRWGRQAFNAGRAFSSGDPARRITPADVPRGELAGRGYRFYVSFNMTDLGSGQITPRNMTINSPGTLSRAELVALVEAQSVLLFSDPYRVGQGYGEPVKFVTDSLYVDAIERYTP